MELELLDINRDTNSYTSRNTSTSTSGDNLFFDNESAETALTDLKSNLDELKEIKTEFTAASESMKEQWSGDGGNAYESACNKIVEKIDESIKTLENEITDLEKRRNAIIHTEEYNRSMAMGGR